MKNLFVQIQTKSGRYDGIYQVVEILGGIIAVDINGSTVDFYLGSGEIKKFCDKDGNNLNFKQ